MMTRDDCKKIIENLEIIRHFAEGGNLDSCLHDYTGKFCKWYPVRKTILIACLGKYRIAKNHFVITPDGAIPSKNKPPCRVEH